MIAIQIILVVILLSWFVAQLAKMLDFAMDYGHAFDWVRIRVASSEADKLELLDWFTENMLQIDDMTRLEASEFADEVYQKLAVYSKRMSLYSCVYCIGVRLSLWFSVIIGVGLAAYVDPWYLAIIPFVPVLTFSILDL